MIILPTLHKKQFVNGWRKYLIHLRKDFDLDNEKYLQITLTREELANMVGTATESVIRLLSEFKQDGLIELHGRRIKILDEKTLYKIGNLND